MVSRVVLSFASDRIRFAIDESIIFIVQNVMVLHAALWIRISSGAGEGVKYIYGQMRFLFHSEFCE